MDSMKTHWEMREELVEKAAADDAFRSQLVDDPKAAIKDALGFDVPDSVTIEVHEESATSAHVVLPPMATLSADDLEVVAGGHYQQGVYGNHPHDHAPGMGNSPP